MGWGGRGGVAALHHIYIHSYIYIYIYVCVCVCACVYTYTPSIFSVRSSACLEADKELGVLLLASQQAAHRRKHLVIIRFF